MEWNGMEYGMERNGKFSKFQLTCVAGAVHQG